MFSKRCEYAIKAMIYLNSKSQLHQKININEIADSIDSPIAFTAKILQQLKKSGLITSSQGLKGGFQVDRGRNIKIQDIVYAIDGYGILNSCVLGLKSCSSLKPCPIHDNYLKIKTQILETIYDKDISEFSEYINNESIFLKTSNEYS
ncbi:MAG: Rrf2 family transcriptional regulator [Saprospiraceae bacterium]